MTTKRLVGLLLLTVGLLSVLSCRSASSTATAGSAAPTAVEPLQPAQKPDDMAPSTREPAEELALEPTPAPPTVGPPVPANDHQLSPGDHTFIVRHDGRERSYIVHVPATVTYPAPLVIALHGGGGTGAAFQEQNGLDTVSDREGFIAVYPEGSGVLANRLHTWNSGQTCCGFAMDRNIDDVGFLRMVITDLAARTATDPGRTYMTGHSNGAMMAYRFAAEVTEMVTAIVPIGGAMDLASFSPSRPLPVLHIHSVDDPRALYEGGEGPPFPGTERTVNHEPVIMGIEAWASANGCTGPVSAETIVQGSGENIDQAVDLLIWTDCPDGADVEHLRLSGTGHGWPGVTVARFWQQRLGPPTTIINASEMVWAFASRFES